MSRDQRKYKEIDKQKRHAEKALRQPSITCPVCGCTSYNPTDISEGYCGFCHEFTGIRRAD